MVEAVDTFCGTGTGTGRDGDGTGTGRGRDGDRHGTGMGGDYIDNLSQSFSF